jgi:hypothetical protein
MGIGFGGAAHTVVTSFCDGVAIDATGCDFGSHVTNVRNGVRKPVQRGAPVFEQNGEVFIL